VDALLDNAVAAAAITGTNKRPLEALADMIKGKQGRLRQNLLGRRVDYSGRSVSWSAAAAPAFSAACRRDALELFKPFIFQKLQLRGEARHQGRPSGLVEREGAGVWDLSKR